MGKDDVSKDEERERFKMYFKVRIKRQDLLIVGKYRMFKE